MKKLVSLLFLSLISFAALDAVQTVEVSFTYEAGLNFDDECQSKHLFIEALTLAQSTNMIITVLPALDTLNTLFNAKIVAVKSDISPFMRNIITVELPDDADIKTYEQTCRALKMHRKGQDYLAVANVIIPGNNWVTKAVVIGGAAVATVAAGWFAYSTMYPKKKPKTYAQI